MRSPLRLALLYAAALCCVQRGAANVSPDNGDGATSWLFAMGYEWGTLTGSPAADEWVGVFRGIPLAALAFTDRPDHLAKFIGSDRLLGDYRANPPNGVLAYVDGRGLQRMATLVLHNATLTYVGAGARQPAVKLAFRMIPADFGNGKTLPAAVTLGCTKRADGRLTCELPKPFLFVDNVSNPGTACAKCTTNSQCNSGYCCTTTGQGNKCSNKDGGTAAGANIGCQLTGSTYNCCDSGGNPNVMCGSSCGCPTYYGCSSNSCVCANPLRCGR